MVNKGHHGHPDQPASAQQCVMQLHISPMTINKNFCDFCHNIPSVWTRGDSRLHWSCASMSFGRPNPSPFCGLSLLWTIICRFPANPADQEQPISLAISEILWPCHLAITIRIWPLPKSFWCIQHTDYKKTDCSLIMFWHISVKSPSATYCMEKLRIQSNMTKCSFLVSLIL